MSEQISHAGAWAIAILMIVLAFWVGRSKISVASTNPQPVIRQ